MFLTGIPFAIYHPVYILRVVQILADFYINNKELMYENTGNAGKENPQGRKKSVETTRTPPPA
jgi:hypothetical protein